MSGFTKISVTAASVFCMAISAGANADGLKEKVVGAWTLSEGSETFQDGKKVTPWVAGVVRSCVFTVTEICDVAPAASRSVMFAVPGLTPPTLNLVSVTPPTATAALLLTAM